MTVNARQRICSIIALAAALFSLEAIAKEFVVRPVTDFGGQPITPFAVPLGVAGDRLVLSAIENNQRRIFSTDGSSIQIIDQTIAPAPSFGMSGGYEVATLGGSIYFPGLEVPNVVSLFATDGTSVRGLGGALRLGPQDFTLFNGNLVFSGTSSQLYHTDGTTLREFPIAKSSLTNTARVNSRLLFGGFPVEGGTRSTYSTDGQSLAAVVTTGGQPLSGPQHFAELDGNAYFVATGLGNPVIYRTNNGQTAEQFAALQDFTSTSLVQSMFALQGSLYVVVANGFTEAVFYKSSGSLPSQVLTWQATAGGIDIANGNPPLFVDEHRAYFQVGFASNRMLYAFDGTSFESIDLVGSFANIEVIQLGDRTFFNAQGTFESLEMYELIDGNVVHLGPGLDSMALFRGELFGVNYRRPNSLDPKTLYRTENRQLVPLGDFGGGGIGPSSRFVEFNGRLYFSGQANGQQPQLFAVVEVPEPAIWATLAVTSLAAGLGPLRLGRNRR